MSIGYYTPTKFPIVVAEFALMHSNGKLGNTIMSGKKNKRKKIQFINLTVQFNLFLAYKGPANFSEPIVNFRNVIFDAALLKDSQGNGTIQVTYKLYNYNGPISVLHFNWPKN
jgi:hypothetical protein